MSARADQLLALTERLTARLAEEAAAYEAHRPQGAAATEETARLANLYRHESARLKREPALLAGTPEPLRRRLLEATRAFDAVVARHGRAVAAAKTVTEGLVEAIAREVANQRAAPVGYGASARAAPVDGRAVTLNRRA